MFKQNMSFEDNRPQTVQFMNPCDVASCVVCIVI